MQHSDFFGGKFLLLPGFFREIFWKKGSFLESVKCAISAKKNFTCKNSKKIDQNKTLA
jgi:hypothetical protein